MSTNHLLHKSSIRSFKKQMSGSGFQTPQMLLKSSFMESESSLNFYESFYLNRASFASNALHKDTYQQLLMASPPDMTVALQHREARRVGKVQRETDFCRCCHQPIDKDPFKISCSIDEFAREYQVGSGVTLFFDYIRITIQLLLITTAIIGNFQFFFTVYTCKSRSDCLNFIGIAYAVKDFNYEKKYQLEIQYALSGLSVLLSIIMCLILRLILLRRSEVLDRQRISSRNYTLVLRNLSKHTTAEEIEKFLNEQLSTEVIVDQEGHIEVKAPLKLHKIVFAYKIRHYVEAMREKAKISAKMDHLKQEVEKFKVSRFNKLLRSLEQQKDKLKAIIYKTKKCLLDGNVQKLRARTAFVTFEYEEDAKQALNKWRERFESSAFERLFLCKGSSVRVQRAPEPLDVIWENLEVTWIRKIRVRSLSVLISIFFSVICLFLFSLLSYAQQKYKQNASKDSSALFDLTVGCICFLTVCVANNTICVIVRSLSYWEQHSSYTNQFRSVALRLSWMFFVNSALVPFIMLVLAGKTEQYDVADMLSNILFIFLGNAFATPAAIVINFNYWYRKFEVWYFIRRKDQQNCKLTQFQANALLELPSFFIDWKYAKIFQFYLTSLFFANIFPIGLYIGVITLILMYWSSKYDLTRKCSLPCQLSDELHAVMMFNLCCGPLVYCLGVLLSQIFIVAPKKQETCTIVFLAIAIPASSLFVLFHKMILRMSIFKNMISSQRKNKKKDTYSYTNAKQFFGIDYELANPITVINAQNIVPEQSESSAPGNMSRILEDVEYVSFQDGNQRDQSRSNFDTFSDKESDQSKIEKRILNSDSSSGNAQQLGLLGYNTALYTLSNGRLPLNYEDSMLSDISASGSTGSSEQPPPSSRLNQFTSNTPGSSFRHPLQEFKSKETSRIHILKNYALQNPSSIPEGSGDLDYLQFQKQNQMSQKAVNMRKNFKKLQRMSESEFQAGGQSLQDSVIVQKARLRGAIHDKIGQTVQNNSLKNMIKDKPQVNLSNNSNFLGANQQPSKLQTQPSDLKSDNSQ